MAAASRLRLGAVLGCLIALSLWTGAKAQTSSPVRPGYDRGLFENAIPPDQIAFLKSFDGKKTRDVIRDKQVRKLLKLTVPNVEYHYGRDMPLMDALDMVLQGADDPVLLRADRYLMFAGAKGPYLGGRGFLWFDLQDGIMLGGFFFQPTNGEPTPSLSVFSRQLTALAVRTEQLPDAFMDDLIQWSTAYHVPPVTTRYFLTGSKKRILLEHDEDYCARADGSAPDAGDPCRQTMAYAADVDETAAYYLVQIKYATNGTAWMIGPDQTLWLRTRFSVCGGPDPLGCRIRVTREHTRMILHGPGTVAVTHPHR